MKYNIKKIQIFILLFIDTVWTHLFGFKKPFNMTPVCENLNIQ